MPVPCGRSLDALGCNEERSNAWVRLRNSGWRKLDDRTVPWSNRPLVDGSANGMLLDRVLGSAS